MFELRSTGFDQDDATNTTRKTHRYSDTDRSRSDDRNFNLRRAAFG